MAMRAHMHYEFELANPVSDEVKAAFPELAAARIDHGALLRGEVTDQAHLHGLLRRFEALGLTLVQMHQLPPG